MSLRADGTPEQKAAFPKALFLYQFVRAWNNSRNDADFLEDQLAHLVRFDKAKRPSSPIVMPVSAPSVTPAPPEPSRGKPLAPANAPIHRPIPSTPARHPQPVKLARSPSPSPSPSPPPPTLKPVLKASQPTRVPDRPTAPGDRERQQRRVVVEVPPRTPKKFKEIDSDDDAYSPSPPPDYAARAGLGSPAGLGFQEAVRTLPEGQKPKVL